VIRALLLGLALGLATPAPAQQVAYGSLTQPRQIAVILDAVERGDIALAERLLAGSRFDQGDLGYQAALLQARVLRARGDLAGAETLLRAILRERPEFRAVRAELAGVLAEAGRGRAARGELRALAQGAANPDERRAFEGLLDRVGTGAGLRFSGFGALLSDTNINSGTDAATVLILGVPFPVPANQRRTSGQGIRLGGTAVWERPMGPGTLYAAGRITLDDYAGRTFDRQALDLRLGVRSGTERGFWAVEAGADRSWLGHAGLDRGLGWRLYGAHALAPDWRLSGELRGGTRRYDLNAGGTRHGAALRLRLDHALRPGLTVWGEVEMAREDVPAQPITGFDRCRLALGVEHQRMGGLGLAAQAGLGFDRHHAPYPGLATERRDHRADLSVTLWHERVTLRGFQPRLTVTAVRNRSNATIQRFDKLETSLTVVRRF
jgi:hypothetical protein